MKLELRPAPGLAAQDRDVLAEINELIGRGVDRFAAVLHEAARKFLTLSEKGRERMKQHPNPAMAALAARLERVAAKELHPRLALLNGWAARKLEHLDYTTQERVLTDLIPVALPDGDHLNKAVEDLSREETAQVFDSTVDPPAIRSLDEQRAWLAAKKLEAQRRARQERATRLIVRPSRYRIQGTAFFPLKDRFTLRELETVLAEMKRLQN